MGNNPSTLGVRPRVDGFILSDKAASQQWQEWQRRSGRSEDIKKESLRAEPREAWQSTFESRISGFALFLSNPRPAAKQLDCFAASLLAMTI
jgi:hypothetical protein